jgi:4-hydroxybenzoate polyprenyltransferase
MGFLLFLLVKPGLGLTVNEGMTLGELSLLIVAVLFTAAGGYVINDLNDLKTDAINKPGKNVFEKSFSVKRGKVFYWVFTLGGILAGSVLSFLLHKNSYALIYIFTAGLLWFYATRYECQPLVGNFVVAFLSALSFGLVWLYELMALQMQAVVVDRHRLLLVNTLVLIYMGFAFLVSLLREVVKDIEDEKGDRQTGCLTFPVTYGIKKAVNMAIAVNLSGLVASFAIQWFFYKNGFNVLFLFFFLVDFLFGFILLKLVTAGRKEHFNLLSLWIKLLMVAGILSMGLFYFE